MPRRYQPYNYHDLLKRVLANVETNIREQHRRANTIGRLGRGNREQLLERIRPVPRLPEFDVDAQDDEELTP